MTDAAHSLTLTDDAHALLAQLASLKTLFQLPDGVIYLDGNSLGPMPRCTATRLAHVISHDWAQGLIRSWNDAGWIDLPRRCAAALAPMVGCEPQELAIGDSTSLNLFKVLSLALSIQHQRAPERRIILSESDNFPTDLYIAEGLGAFLSQLGGPAWEVRTVLHDELMAQLTGPDAAHIGVLMLTEVNYRTGRRHDMQALTQAAHQAGALTVWDLAHSAGAFPVQLSAAQADFAVGCGYKYLNGGPGAPAFAFVAQRFFGQASALTGWLGHAAPFAFEQHWQGASGAASLQVGTPPVLSMEALLCGLQTLQQADALGGLAALRRKAELLTDRFIARTEAELTRYGLVLVTPKTLAQRGNQVSYVARPDAQGNTVDGYAVMQALIQRGVIGDFRAPDLIRFGFAPSYLDLADVDQAADILLDILATRSWDSEAMRTRAAVT